MYKTVLVCLLVTLPDCLWALASQLLHLFVWSTLHFLLSSRMMTPRSSTLTLYNLSRVTKSNSVASNIVNAGDLIKLMVLYKKQGKHLLSESWKQYNAGVSKELYLCVKRDFKKKTTKVWLCPSHLCSLKLKPSLSSLVWSISR